MRLFRTRPGLRVLAVVLASISISFGCLPADRASQEDSTPKLEGEWLAGTAPGKAPREALREVPREGTRGEGSGGKTLSAIIPQEDARGEPVPWLPRPPGSVRVGYSEREDGGLVLLSASYLTVQKTDAVLGFYRGVFAAEGWQVANVEYSGGGWHFLVLREDLEAKVKVLARDGGSEAGVELSGPAGGAQESWASAGGSKR